MRHWINLFETARPQMYLRFGEIPENERSGIGRAPNHVAAMFHHSLEAEHGVSCYFVEWNAGRAQWEIDAASNIASLVELVDQASEGRRNIYIITGDLLDEPGIDGEPLLRNVKIVQKVESVRDLYAPGVFDGRESELVYGYSFDELLIIHPDGSEYHEGAGQMTYQEIDETLGGWAHANGFDVTYNGEKVMFFRSLVNGPNQEPNPTADRLGREQFGFPADSPKLLGPIFLMKGAKSFSRYL